MNKILISSIVVLSLIQLFSAQTFQYSRGWTNGKRSGNVESSPLLKQMTSSPLAQVLTANDLSNRERLMQHLMRNPCDIMTLMARSLKSPEDYPMALTTDGYEDDIPATRYKREIMRN